MNIIISPIIAAINIIYLFILGASALPLSTNLLLFLDKEVEIE
jgi:hypothetical protein